MDVLAAIGKTIFGMTLAGLFFWAWFWLTEWMDENEDIMAIFGLIALAAAFIGLGALVGHGIFMEVFG